MYATRKNQLVNEGALPDRNAPQKHWMERDDEKRSRSRNFTRWKVYRLYEKSEYCICEGTCHGKREAVKPLSGTLGNYYLVCIRWSPDSKKVASCKIRPVEERYVSSVESSPAR